MSSLHVIAVAESDSYLKWAVSLLGTLPRSTPSRRHARLLADPPVGLAARGGPRRARRTPAGSWRSSRPARCCAGSNARAAGRRPHRLRRARARTRYSDALSRSPHRPVLLAGIPGIALPARRRAWGYRGAIDLLVVHSHREVAEYDAVRVQMRQDRPDRARDDPVPRRPPRAAAGRRRRPARGGGGRGTRADGRPRQPCDFRHTGQGARRERDDRLAILLAPRPARPPPARTCASSSRPGGRRASSTPTTSPTTTTDLLAVAGDLRPGARPRGAVEFAGGSMAEQLDDGGGPGHGELDGRARGHGQEHPGAARRRVRGGREAAQPGLRGQRLPRRPQGAGDRGLPAPGAAGGCSTTTSTRRPENTWVPMLDELVAEARAGELPPIAAGPRPRPAAPAGAAVTAARSRAAGSGLRPQPPAAADPAPAARRPGGDLARRAPPDRRTGGGTVRRQCRPEVQRARARNAFYLGNGDRRVVAHPSTRER